MIPGVEDVFTLLKEHQIPYYLLTNDASRSPRKLAEFYQKAGIEEITADKMISSGMLAKKFLKAKVREGIVAYLGTEQSAHYVENSGFTTCPVGSLTTENFDNINALVLLDDEGFNWEKDINIALNLIRKRNIPVIVANTDRTYPVSKNEVALAIGGISMLMEKIVRKIFIRFGKPDSQMFQFTFDRLQNHGHFGRKDVLMVGDTLVTDILGGNHFGLDTALVLTGNTLPHQAEAAISSTGIIPTYVCESVVG